MCRKPYFSVWTRSTVYVIIQKIGCFEKIGAESATASFVRSFSMQFSCNSNSHLTISSYNFPEYLAGDSDASRAFPGSWQCNAVYRQFQLYFAGNCRRSRFSFRGPRCGGLLWRGHFECVSQGSMAGSFPRSHCGRAGRSVAPDVSGIPQSSPGRCRGSSGHADEARYGTPCMNPAAIP